MNLVTSVTVQSLFATSTRMLLSGYEAEFARKSVADGLR